MARSTFEGWMTEEKSSKVILKINETSAIEALARHESMNTEVKSFNRSGGVGVSMIAKGAAYPEDTSAVDDIEIKAVKFGTAVRIAEEDIDDSPTEIIGTKKLEWARSYAITLDQAALGVTAAIGTGVPFTSVYKALTTTDATSGYTANDNLILTAGAVTYDDLVDLLAKIESSDYFDEAGTVIIAHPSFRTALRKLKDDNGDPIYQKDITGATPGSILGHTVRWSLGARKHATATSAPTGNPLMIAGNRDLLILGDRTQPESIVIDGRDGLSALTDETILKMRARKAFGVGRPNAFAALELTAA